MSIQKVLQLEELPLAVREELKANGYVNAQGEVCLGFMKPSGPPESGGLEELLKSALGREENRERKYKPFDKAKADAKVLKGEIKPDISKNNIKYFLEIGLKEPMPREYASPIVIQRLKRVFKDNKLNRPEKFCKSGLLDFKHITRLPMTNRVFMKKHRNKRGQNYVIHLAIDVSGSMHGNDPKSLLSSIGANLVQDLRGIAKVALYTHETNAQCVKCPEESSDIESCIIYHNLLVGLWRIGGDNLFSKCFNLIAQKIKAYPDKAAKHLVFFCADGGNCGGSDEYKACLKSVKALEKIAQVVLIGVIPDELQNKKENIRILTAQTYESTHKTMQFFYSINDIYNYIIDNLKSKLIRKM